MSSRLQRHLNSRPGSSLRRRIGRSVVLIAAIPLLMAAIAYVYFQHKAALSHRAHQLEWTAQTVANNIDQFLSAHRAAILQSALDLPARACDSSACQARRLDELRQNYPIFISALSSNAEGDVVAISAERIPANMTAANVADRDYFKMAVHRKGAYISDTFVGRGLGEDVLIAISAPIRNDFGVAGVVEGSLDLGKLSTVLEHAAAGMENRFALMLVDRANRNVVGFGGDFPRRSESVLPWMQARGIDDLSAAAVRTGYANLAIRTVPISNWHVVAIEQKQSLFDFAGVAPAALATLISLLIIVSWAGGRAAHSIAMPLEDLIAKIQDVAFDQLDSSPSLPPLKRGVLNEVAEIHDAVGMMLGRLSQSYRSQSSAMSDLDAANRQLRLTVAERDTYIARQTRELRESLSFANKGIEARDLLLANTSHDIRTPLNGIIGTTELLRLRAEDDDLKHSLDGIMQAAEGLLTLINDLLDLSRINAGQMQLAEKAFSPVVEVRAAVDAVTILARKRGLDLSFQSELAESAQFKGDGLRLRQIAMNLLGNAVKFTERGSVRVTLRSAKEGSIELEVRDTGIGISRANQQRVFEPFVQVDSAASRRFQGTGLGLAITRKLVELMQGTLSLVSEVGKGSDFRITLPLAPSLSSPDSSTTALPDTAIDAESSTARSSMRILVVDDVELNRRVLLAQLQALDWPADAVGSGAEALAAIEARRYDIILLDVQMPVMDGYEVARRIRARSGSRIRPLLVAVTANARESEEARCVAAGMNGYLAKPVRLKDLREVLARAKV